MQILPQEQTLASSLGQGIGAGVSTGSQALLSNILKQNQMQQQYDYQSQLQQQKQQGLLEAQRQKSAIDQIRQIEGAKNLSGITQSGTQGTDQNIPTSAYDLQLQDALSTPIFDQYQNNYMQALQKGVPEEQLKFYSESMKPKIAAEQKELDEKKKVLAAQTVTDEFIKEAEQLIGSAGPVNIAFKGDMIGQAGKRREIEVLNAGFLEKLKEMDAKGQLPKGMYNDFKGRTLDPKDYEFKNRATLKAFKKMVNAKLKGAGLPTRDIEGISDKKDKKARKPLGDYLR